MTINLSTLVNYSTKVHTDEIGVTVAPLDYNGLVPSANLPSYVHTDEIGVTVAPLDNNGLVPSANLPSYVDDVLEFADLASFPSVGDTGVIYIAIVP